MRNFFKHKGQASNSKDCSKLSVVVVFSAFLLTGYLLPRAIHAEPFAQAAGSSSTVVEKNVALGLNHFDSHCASCHATTGKADIAKGKAVKAADLTSQEVQSMSDDELFRVISNGVPGTAMPAFGKSHKPDEIRHIIMFLRKLPTLTEEERKKIEAAVPEDARHKHDDHNHKDHQHEHTPATSDKPAPRQEQQAQQHVHPAADTAKAADEHAGHNASAGASGHNTSAMMTTITGGPFKSMHAIGSGTSLLPASSPGYMWHWMKGDWMIMGHGDLKVGFNHQGGPRGVNKAESQNWLMLMGERQAGRGRLMLRGMFSAEPWTAPRRGFPELFQTGEVFEGRPIIDAQHPHDLFMELAAAYTLPLSENVSLQFYGGPVGEPALGPVAFMHRMSAAENPAAPLAHHWQDSTHIAHGVLTAALTAGRFKIESSIFRGAEPDENRKTIDFGKLDSYSGRLWFTPTPDWAMQFSYGYLTNPEAIEPGDLKRLTASISHNRSWQDGHWASTLVWGRNSEEHGISNAYLLESTVNFLDKNYFYTRLELGDKNGLLQENIFGRPGLVSQHQHTDGFRIADEGDEHEDLADRWFRVGAFTFGGVRDLVANSKMRVGIGADVTFYHVPDGLKAIYGSSPTSYHVFLRFRPGKMAH